MGWKSRGRMAGLVLVAANFVAANAGNGLTTASASVSYDWGDPRSLSADHAQDTFETFLAIAAPSDTVKIADPGSDALIWVSDVRKNGMFFVGTPVHLAATTNSTIVFHKTHILDWATGSGAGIH